MNSPDIPTNVGPFGLDGSVRSLPKPKKSDQLQAGHKINRFGFQCVRTVREGVGLFCQLRVELRACDGCGYNA